MADEKFALQIIKDARKLKQDRFQERDTDLRDRQDLRFRKKDPQVPVAYKDTATVYKSPVLQDEGRQVASLIYATPVVTCPAPTPELQVDSTSVEKFCHALFQQAEAYYGAVWWKNTVAQIHADLSCVYLGWKRDAYAGAPKAPDEDDYLATANWNMEMDAFKRAQGVESYVDYRHVPTETVYYRGPVQNPLAVYEVKQVDEADLMLEYGLKKDYDGKLMKFEGTTMPSGVPEDSGLLASARKLSVIEYWDREQCVIVLEHGTDRWRGSIASADTLVLDEWKHGWGRVPYFFAPAFENEVMDEALKYESPLSALYAEVPMYNDLRTMQSNVAYLKGYPTWQDVPQPNPDTGLDETSQKRTHEKFQPGVIYDMLPGHEMKTVPMDTGQELLQEVLAAEGRIRQYSLSDVSKGVSPGADTANSAITQLRRLQRSSLSPMNENQARQAREMFRFVLERVKESGEPHYVYAQSEKDVIGLSADQIPSMNLQVKVAPDTGQDMLIEEKQAAELLQLGIITEMEFHERRGKENPEEYVKANILQRQWMMLEAKMTQYIDIALGDTQAIEQMVAASMEGGDPEAAIPNIMDQIREGMGKTPTGMGQGSGGMPRDMGVRSPAVQTTTQPQGGVGPFQ